jgi:hypothetical protein
MNVERCVELHNKTLHHAWVGQGHSADTFESRCLTWHERDPAVADEVRDELSHALSEFPQQAAVLDRQARGSSASTTLSQPSQPFLAMYQC